MGNYPWQVGALVPYKKLAHLVYKKINLKQ